jgi:hypothetical protein
LMQSWKSVGCSPGSRPDFRGTMDLANAKA